MDPECDLADIEFLKNIQNRAGFVRPAYRWNILSPIEFRCRRLALSVSPISFRLTMGWSRNVLLNQIKAKAYQLSL
ncbi:MAG: hypothetical protein LLG40_15780, partial [Deltaproteobacteria bacterium]|nr:hypothetical protein [Deltaproteobacteria bacterium]